MLHGQAQVRQHAHDVIRRVDRHLVGAGHAHRRIAEHAHHLFDGVLAGQGIAALQHADLFLGMGQKDVDSRSFTLAPFLDAELDARILRHILVHDLFSSVGATRGHDNDLRDLDLKQQLVDYGLQQATDVGFFIVGRDAHTALDGIFAHAEPTTVRQAMRAVRGRRSHVSFRVNVQAMRLGRR